MFGIWNTRKPLVYMHRFVTLPDFETSVVNFYTSIENDLKEKALDGLKISRVEYAEGGMFSAKRTYLRLQRERLIFDVCAAPFGKTWFFSYRAAEVPCSLRVWELLVLLAFLAMAVAFYATLFGWLSGSILFGLSVVGIAVLLRNALALGLSDLDATVLRISIVGGVYEALLRRETYYREDTRAAYLKIVEDSIVEKIEEVTGGKGVKLLKLQTAAPAGSGMFGVLAALLRFTR